MPSFSFSSLNRRAFLKVAGATAVAAWIGAPFKALAAEKPEAILIQSSQPSWGMPVVIGMVDAAGRGLVVESPKDLSDGKANTQVNVYAILPGHADKDGNTNHKLPFIVKDGQWSVNPAASYKDGQRCDVNDRDMVALAALLQAGVAKAKPIPHTPIIRTFDETRSIGILYEKDRTVRADIHNTDLNVTASFENEAFVGGKMSLGTLRWAINAPSLGLSPWISDTVNKMKLTDPSKYSSDEKRVIVATMAAIALKEANILKNEYRGAVKAWSEANKKITPQMAKLWNKDLAPEITDIHRDFKNGADAAPFEAALKLPLDQAVAKLNKLLAGGAGPTAALNVGSTVAVAGMLGAGAKEESERPAMTRRAFLRLLKPSKGA